MITVEQARQIDPTLEDLSDAELTAVLEILENLADIALEALDREKEAVSKVPEGHLPGGEDSR